MVIACVADDGASSGMSSGLDMAGLEAGAPPSSANRSPPDEGAGELPRPSRSSSPEV